MNPFDYLHERDIYYVVDHLHRSSLTNVFGTHHYALNNHRTVAAPSFSDQRKILVILDSQKIISLTNSYGKDGRHADPTTAWSFDFKRHKKDILIEDLLDIYHGRLMLKLEEAHMNKQSLNTATLLPLSIDDGNIYVHFEFHKLKVTRDSLRTANTPELFFEHLINHADGQRVTRDSLHFRTTRKFKDLVIKAGFEKKMRLFIKELTDDSIILMPEIWVDIKQATALYNQLIKMPENKATYDKYLEGIT